MELYTTLKASEVKDETKGDHYREGYTEQIEVLRIVQDKLSPAELKGAYRFNVVKYVLRAPWKGGLKDYKKALYYLNLLVALEEDAS